MENHDEKAIDKKNTSVTYLTTGWRSNECRRRRGDLNLAEDNGDGGGRNRPKRERGADKREKKGLNNILGFFLIIKFFSRKKKERESEWSGLLPRVRAVMAHGSRW